MYEENLVKAKVGWDRGWEVSFIEVGEVELWEEKETTVLEQQYK